MLEKLISVASRLFFVGAFILFGLAVCERIAYAAGYTIVGTITSSRMMEIAVVLLVFVITLQLREMKGELKKKTP